MRFPVHLIILGAISAWLPGRLSAAASPEKTYVNFEGKQTSPVRLSPDGTRLFAVNTADARLSVFDLSNPSNPVLIAEIPVGLEPVSVNPVSNDEAWVVNEVSDSVSVVSVSRGIVTDTLPAKDEPADVVFAAGRAWVSCSRNNLIRVFDLSTHEEQPPLPLLGNNPRALAVSRDGRRVYAAFALSGNRTTLVPAGQAPAQPAPLHITNAPPQVGLIVDAADPAWSEAIRYTMPDHDVVEIDASSGAVIRYFTGVGTVNLGLAVHPTSGDLFVANTEARNLVPFEPGVRGHAIDNRLTRIAVIEGTVTPFDLNPGLDYALLPSPTAQETALAQPTALVCSPDGETLYVAAFGSDRIARMDSQGNVLARIAVGSSPGPDANPRAKRGPRGLALNAHTQRLYALNRIANTLSIIDTARDLVLREMPVGSYDPTPTFIREGRGFLYDAQLSGNGTFSCASCHVDAEMDLLAWDLGNPAGAMEPVTVTTFGGATLSSQRHPMKGPMTTQTLRGLKGLDPLHWRGDRATFIAFNHAFDDLMGGPLLSDADMTLYRQFINSVVFQPNPNQNLDRTLPLEFAGGNPRAGRSAYQNHVLDAAFDLRCITCHAPNAFELPVGNGSSRVVIADVNLQDTQHQKVPHLRNLYQKTGFTNAPGALSLTGFGFSHDGRDSTLFDHLGTSRLGTLTNHDSATLLVKSNLVALLLCFDTGTPPAVGFARTLTPANIRSTTASNDWALLEGQASTRFQDPFILAGWVTNISLVAQGTLDGQRRSLLYRAPTQDYATDTPGVGPFTRAELWARIEAGDTLTLMGVPTLSGYRMALDRDSDDILNGAELPPPLHVMPSGSQIILSWPSTQPPVVLEFTDRLASAAWNIETHARSETPDRVTVTVPVEDQPRFYRLRGL